LLFTSPMKKTVSLVLIFTLFLFQKPILGLAAEKFTPEECSFVLSGTMVELNNRNLYKIRDRFLMDAFNTVQGLRWVEPMFVSSRIGGLYALISHSAPEPTHSPKTFEDIPITYVRSPYVNFLDIEDERRTFAERQREIYVTEPVYLPPHALFGFVGSIRRSLGKLERYSHIAIETTGGAASIKVTLKIPTPVKWDPETGRQMKNFEERIKTYRHFIPITLVIEDTSAQSSKSTE